MSGYRPPQMPSWRAREMARKVAAEDEERRKKTEITETNFPTFVSTQPTKKSDGGNKFASLATQWAVDEDKDRQLESYRKSQAESERRQYESLYRIRAPRNDTRRYSYDDEEESEDTPIPVPVTTAQDDDDAGWVEVKRKIRKPKRELTIAEMEARDRQKDAEEEQAEFNADLYESKRHEHDRV